MSAPKAFVSALSTHTDWRLALSEASAKVRKGLGAPCDLALLFMTELYAGLDPAQVPAFLKKELGCRHLLGCNSSGVIADRQEIEMEPAVTLLGMSLPGVRLTPFSLTPARAAQLSGEELLQHLDIYPTDRPKFLTLADPMTCDIEAVLRLFNEAYPGAPVIGGLASGLAIGKPNWLVLNDDVCEQGAAGLALSGDVEVEIVVAQGCRPIGAPLTITKAEGHILYELGGQPPLEVLRGVIGSLTPADQELARQSLFAGLVMNEYKSDFHRGDFLIRNLMGYDAESGALMIGSQLRVGQTMQFQLRDAKTSDEDLRSLLERMAARDGHNRGALLVSCCGRGRGLYGEPDHDASVIQAKQGPLPLAGFFANGEIGPVGAKNYIHGYTSSLAVIK